MAVDTLIFERGDCWWLITSLDRIGSGDATYELHVYSAANPLAEEWSPHPQNPVKVDSLGGRNAGIAMIDGRLFRFGQTQGFDRYGTGVMIFEIDTLTPHAYHETPLQEVRPSNDRTVLGTHHLSGAGAYTAFDQARKAYFVP